MRQRLPVTLVAACLWGLSGCVEYGSPIAEPPPEPAVETQPAIPLSVTVFAPLAPAEPEPAKVGEPSAPATEAAAAPAELNPADGASSLAEPVPAGEAAPAPAAPPATASGTPPPDLPLLGTSVRPELDPLVADALDVLDYLALSGDLNDGLSRDDWDPTAGAGDVLGFSADFIVAPSGGTHTTVQAAITAAVAAGGSERRFIELTPGTYKEVVCVPSGSPPITLYGTELDASQTVISFDNYSGRPKPSGSPANPCNPNTAGTTFGTSGSATVAVFGRDFVAKNLSFVNATRENASDGGSLQAPALLSQGDRALYDNVRVLGNQGSLLAKTPSVNTVTRAYFKACYVEGDTDFILGRGTLVLDGCTIHSLTARLTGGVFAPSTDARNPFGMLVTHGTFTADDAAEPASLQLGRAWDESQTDLASYAEAVNSGTYPNGQLLVRESLLGAQVDGAAPWRSASSSDRPFASVAGAYPANRLYEYANTGPGSASATAAESPPAESTAAENPAP